MLLLLGSSKRRSGRAGKPGGTDIEWEYQLLAYADDVILLGDNRDTTNGNRNYN
jgi:hypothetical protein